MLLLFNDMRGAFFLFIVFVIISPVFSLGQISNTYTPQKSILYRDENLYKTDSEKKAYCMRRKNDSLEYSKIMAEDYRIENVIAYKQEIEKAFDLYSKENGSIELNKYLTSKEHRHIEEFEKIAQNIITWIKANPLKRNITLYRAINLPKDIFEKYKKNLYVTGIGGIQSLTLSKEHALGFLNYHENNFPILLEISAQKGDMAAPPLRIKKGSMIGYPEEQEFDTLPTTKFKINSIRYNGKYYTFDVVME